eukprot:CAMPEP_0118637604 /NCGR_PEP_ID=MMETSP0785-20121206/3238_1 /TAXON_ID=91992 /ORGANISM="Bolidomonas pacifica, Strain CCMP 1866" /LENGTH=65 /DNA_ID=CAMNT_0006528795 /DNA_START=562 /DNA_END=755 /DNA_ORIENTATION=+
MEDVFVGFVDIELESGTALTLPESSAISIEGLGDGSGMGDGAMGVCVVVWMEGGISEEFILTQGG